MPVPKRKTSKSRRDKRQSNKGLDFKPASVCQTCQAPVASHQVCKECGHYKGKKVLRTKTDRLHARGQVRKEREEKIKASSQNVQPETTEESKKE